MRKPACLPACPPFLRVNHSLADPSVGVPCPRPRQLVHMVSGGERLAIPPREAVAGATPSPELYDTYVALIRRCWAQQPQERPGFAEIIQELR